MSSAPKRSVQDNKPYKCGEDECAKHEGFRRPGDLRVHQNRKHKKTKRPYQCPDSQCQSHKGYWKSGQLKNHIARKHKENFDALWKTVLDGRPVLKCTVAGCKDAISDKIFGNSEAFKKHMGAYERRGEPPQDTVSDANSVASGDSEPEVSDHDLSSESIQSMERSTWVDDLHPAHPQLFTSPGSSSLHHPVARDQQEPLHGNTPSPPQIAQVPRFPAADNFDYSQWSQDHQNPHLHSQLNIEINAPHLVPNNPYIVNLRNNDKDVRSALNNPSKGELFMGHNFSNTLSDTEIKTHKQDAPAREVPVHHVAPDHLLGEDEHDPWGKLFAEQRMQHPHDKEHLLLGRCRRGSPYWRKKRAAEAACRRMVRDAIGSV
ncbi:hypothetical protein T439DRAFT_360868 [Meredithblackwellia eburnea MCA 4105]